MDEKTTVDSKYYASCLLLDKDSSQFILARGPEDSVVIPTLEVPSGDPHNVVAAKAISECLGITIDHSDLRHFCRVYSNDRIVVNYHVAIIDFKYFDCKEVSDNVVFLNNYMTIRKTHDVNLTWIIPMARAGLFASIEMPNLSHMV